MNRQPSGRQGDQIEPNGHVLQARPTCGDCAPRPPQPLALDVGDRFERGLEGGALLITHPNLDPALRERLVEAFQTQVHR